MENEKVVSDGPRSEHRADSPLLTEDIEEYFSARSHFSEYDETSAVALNREASSILTETENKRLNTKIDRLMAALTIGRQVRFDLNPVTGEFDVSALYPATESSREGSKLEAEISASPENFGNIISSRHQMLRSPNSIQYPIPSSSSYFEDQYETWEEAIAAADERYEVENGPAFTGHQEGDVAFGNFNADVEQKAPSRNATKIHRALRRQEQAMEEPRGRRLARMGPIGIEVYEIFPILLDFNKKLEILTPSVNSNDSHIAYSSLIFKTAHGKMAQVDDSWATTSGSDELSELPIPSDRVLEWLERVETPPQVRTPVLLKRRTKDVRVFRDAPVEEGNSRGARNIVSASKTLKDVSNLRRPGYLKHNSFAKENKSTNSPAQNQGSGLVPHTFGGASDPQGRRSFIKSKWPGLFSPIHEQVSPAPSDKPLNLPERVAHFELALARLEGRIPPEPSSPIQRYVHTESVYGDDVDVDLRLVRFRQPRAVRYTDGPSVAQQFEQVLGEDVDPEAHLDHRGDEEQGLTWR